MIELNTPILDDMLDEMNNLSLEHGTLEFVDKNFAKERDSSEYISKLLSIYSNQVEEIHSRSLML